MKRLVQRCSFGCVVAAVVVGMLAPGVPIHASPIAIGPEVHNGVTVWTGSDSADFDVARILGLVGPFGTATLTTSSGVVFTAVESGGAGHDITITIVDSGVSNAPLSVAVTDRAITISLATDAAGTPTSTAAQVASAVNANPAASTLVSTSTGGGPGTNIVGALGQTALTPVITGNAGLAMLYQSGFGEATLTTSDGVVFTAVAPGADGHDITITIVDPGAPNAPLSVSVAGDAITISLATDASGMPVSTAAQVVSAVNANPAASTLVSASAGGLGTDVVGVLGQTALSPFLVEAGAYAGSYDAFFSNSASHPQDAIISYLLGEPSIAAGSLYLYVKDGGQTPAFYLYDLLARPDVWNGIDDLILSGFWAPGGSITSVKLFGTPAAVPEVSSIALLALGLGARAWRSRRPARRNPHRVGERTVTAG